MRRPRYLLLGGVLVTIAEAALGTAVLLGHGPIEISLYLFACGGATGLVTSLAAALLRRRGGGDHGPSTEDPEPPWWPDFEADFWRRVRERERAPA